MIDVEKFFICQFSIYMSFGKITETFIILYWLFSSYYQIVSSLYILDKIYLWIDVLEIFSLS